MSLLEELLKEHCPDGVEYKTLSELGSFYAGLNGKNKDDFKDGNAKYITYMNVFSNLSVNLNINDTVQIDKKEKQNIVQYGDIIFTGSSETREECGMSSVLTKEPKEKLYLNSFCFGFRFNDKEIMLPDFSKYLFRSIELRKKIIQTSSGVTRFNVSKKKMETISIPLPPIEIQKEIVRILDAFTEYQNCLNEELTLRKKQYEYYRDKLLTFGDDVELKKLVDVSEIKRGIRVVKSQLSDNYKYPVYQNSLTPLGFYENNNVDCNSSFIITAGAAGEIGYSKDRFWAADDCFYFKSSNIIINKYIYYFLLSKQYYLYSQVRKASIPRLSRNTIENLKIPVPPLEYQERIVKILDRFDALCNDISSGLPAEIEMRKKQYEYYRDKLLTFKEKKIKE